MIIQNIVSKMQPFTYFNSIIIPKIQTYVKRYDNPWVSTKIQYVTELWLFTKKF